MNDRRVCTIRRSALAILVAVLGYLTIPKPAAAQWSCPLCMIDPTDGDYTCIQWYVGAQNCMVLGKWCIMWDECQVIMSTEFSEDGSAHLPGVEVELWATDPIPESADGTVRRTCDGIILKRREIDEDMSGEDAPVVLAL